MLSSLAAAPEGAIKLFGEVVLPVCSPKLVTRTAPLATPEDLRRHVLLHYERPEVRDFAAWLIRQAKQEARYRGYLLQ
jgi:LysR family glycine cleavage system transcriptional activator